MELQIENPTHGVENFLNLFTDLNIGKREITGMQFQQLCKRQFHDILNQLYEKDSMDCISALEFLMYDICPYIPTRLKISKDSQTALLEQAYTICNQERKLLKKYALILKICDDNQVGSKGTRWGNTIGEILIAQMTATLSYPKSNLPNSQITRFENQKLEFLAKFLKTTSIIITRLKSLSSSYSLRINGFDNTNSNLTNDILEACTYGDQDFLDNFICFFVFYIEYLSTANTKQRANNIKAIRKQIGQVLEGKPTDSHVFADTRFGLIDLD